MSKKLWELGVDDSVAEPSDVTSAVADKRDKTDLAVYTFAPWTVDGVEFSWDSGMLWKNSGNSLYYSNGVWTMIDVSEMYPTFTATGDEHAMSLSLVGVEHTVTATRSQIYVSTSDDSVAKKSDLTKLSYYEWNASTTYTVGQGVTYTTTTNGTSTTKVYICRASTATVGTFVESEWSDLGTQPLQTVASKVTALETDKQDVISDLATIRSGAAAGATAAQPGDVTSAVATHNASNSAHGDIRNLIAAKQDAISDLATIRSGAAAGATAAQPGDVTSAVATHNASNSAHSDIRTALADNRDKTDLAAYERPYLPWTINGEELTYSNGLWSSVSYSMWYEAAARGWAGYDNTTGRTLGSPMTSEDALDVWLTDTLGEVSVEATRTGVYGDPTATSDTLALTSAITTHNASAAAHSALFAAKRDTDDNACHETTDGFSPWFATPPSGYTFGDAQPVFDSTTSKWTWYVEGTGVAVDAESGTSTEDATSATFTFEDSGTKTFTATRFAAVESTEGENYVTKSYVASQFSSANTSLRADNIRMTAADATTIKAYIDAKLGEIETALTRILGGN